MENIKKYDAIIIGSGQAGDPLASGLTSKGQKVAMIERDQLGGSCINYGCTPTKTLIASANLHHSIQNSEELGITTENTKLDFKKVMERKNHVVGLFRGGLEKSFEGNENIDLYKGEASFIDRNTVSIKLNSGGEEQIWADKIFINTGANPSTIPLDGLDDIEYLNSTTIMELNALPEHLVIIGTSYIALEFGQMFRRFGSRVSMVGRGDHILKREDPDISERLQKILEDEGIDFLLNTDTKRVEKNEDGITLYIEKDGKEDKIDGSHLMLATGRIPNSKELDLEKAGVEVDDKGNIKIDEKLVTAVAHIYALGDIKGGPAFTHISYDDFRIIMDNLFGEKKRTIHDRLVPYTLFTQPQLGRVGLTEAQAIKKGYDVEIGKLEMKNVGKAIEESRTEGFMKAVVNKKDNKILGVAILGYQGGEIMAMVEIAMMAGMTYDKLRDGIFTHPNLSESLNNLFSI